MSGDGVEKVREAFGKAEDVDLPDDLAAEAERMQEGSGTPPPDEPNERSGAPDGPPPPEIEGAKLPLNDTGNGMRFALYYADEALFVPRVGWHVWDKRRWKLDPDSIVVRRHAQKLQEHIVREIPHAPLNGAERQKVERIEQLRHEISDLERNEDEDAAEKKAECKAQIAKLNSEIWGKGSTRQRHLTFSRSAGNTGAIKNMLTEAVTKLAKEVEDLDADPLTVNTRTGILSFKVHDMREEGGGKVAGFEILPHTREVVIEGRNQPQYITKMMPVDHDPDAACPKFEKMLSVVQPDPEVRAFLQRWFGLSMTALPVQKFLYCYGMGANGKSLLANLMRRMLGDYATMIKIQSLTGQNRKSGSDATPDLMKLIGARAAITSEPEEGERMQEQKIKEMTGGDAMLVRNLHADFVEFTPYFKLTFTGNHKLEIRGTDDGIWRRPLLLPFDVQIPESQRDEKLGERLFEEERSGILNWMIAGLIDYLEGGLQEPAQVREATEEYRRDSDPIGDFLANACVMDGGTDWLSARDLIDACYLYQLENTGHAWQPGNLSRKLKERSGKYHHPKSGKTYARHKRGVWGYTGLALAAEMRAKLDAAPRDGKGLPLLPSSERHEDDPL